MYDVKFNIFFFSEVLEFLRKIIFYMRMVLFWDEFISSEVFFVLFVLIGKEKFKFRI